MAEILGALASAITIGEVVGKAVQLVRRLQNAPQDIVDLASEATDLKMVMADMTLSLKGDGMAETLAAVLSPFLPSVEAGVREFDDFISSLCEVKNNRICFRRARFVIEKRRAKGLQSRLAGLRRSITTIMTYHNVLSSHRIEAVLADLLLHVGKCESKVEALHLRVGAVCGPLSSAMGTNDIARTATAPGHSEPILGHSAMQVSKLHRRSASYALGCTCACHRVVTTRTPTLLRSIFGLLWLDSTAWLPRACQRCSGRRCREQVPTLKLLYLLPPWLLHRAIYFIYLHTKLGPSMGLAIRTIVPINSNLLTSAASGHVDRVRYLFQTRQSTPNDIHTVSGETPLHFAIKYGQLDMCKALIDAGADMYVEDHRGRAAIDVAWMEIMANCKDEKFLEGLRTLFGDVDHFQLRRLGELHQAVCGFSKKSLVEVLNHSRANGVDDVDEEGKTALAWAVLRGDTQTVQLLLERGADPNISDSNGDSPLALCTHGREPLIMNSLVLAGATFTGNLRKYNPLHKAAFRQNNADFLRPLIRAFSGIVDSLSDSGETPLALATFRDNDAVACFLLDSGAQIDTVDDSGTTPIFDAVKYRSHRTLEMLIRKRARLEHRTGAGQSLLHHVAEWGDCQGVEILRRHASDMKVVDTGWRDSAGRTALDVVERRASAPKGFVEAFRALISDLQTADESPSDDDDKEEVDEKDVFYDCRTFV